MTATEQRPRPDNVPEHLVVDYDPIADVKFGARWQTGLAAIFKRVGPIFWTPRQGGQWIVGGYEAVWEIARDVETFSSDHRKHPAFKDMPVLIPLNLDPPEHTGYRAPVSAALSPRVVNAMKDGIRDYAASLVAAFADKGEVDALAAYAEPLPVVVFLRLLGLPTDRVHEFRDLMVTVLTAPDPADRAKALGEVAAICAPFVQARTERREDDLISHLLDAQIDGRPMTFEEVIGYCVLLFAAGLDTVVNSLSFGMYHLAIDQELQVRLRADPSLIPRAMEEFVRRYSIVTNARIVLKDREFQGVSLKRFDRLIYCTPAANLDPAIYDHAETIDLAREERPHIGFLAGPHRCAGSHLARLEMTIGYEELFKRVPQFRLADGATIEPLDGFTYGLKAVPLVWDAA